MMKMKIFLTVLLLGSCGKAVGDAVSDRLAEEIVRSVEVDELPDDGLDEEDDDYLDTHDTVQLSRRAVSLLPESLDLRDTGTVHSPIGQGSCGSCGWVSGTQTLESRVALVAENYIPYSIQHFMNCNNKVCKAAQPYSVTTYAMKHPVIVPEDEIPYTQWQCYYADDCDDKCGTTNPYSFNNALHDQFVVIAGTVTVKTEEDLLEALQDGPVTTCFAPKQSKDGERCSFGCSHANSVIGYTKDKLLLQESFGETWGDEGDGSWLTTKGSACSRAIVSKARYPRVIYDFDRANAYFTKIEEGIDESDLTLVARKKYGITDANTKNWGTAKNKCAFIGSACKGVVELSSGAFELVSDFGPGSLGGLSSFKKSQMVNYLKNSESGKYIGIKKAGSTYSMITTDTDNAAPFYTSYNRFLSFDNPRYEIVWKYIKKMKDDIFYGNKRYAWKLNDCKLYSPESNKFLDVVDRGNGEWKLSVSDFDKDSSTQRFDLGVSGPWNLHSRHLNEPLRLVKGSGSTLVFNPVDVSKTTVATMMWNARQIMTRTGRVIGPNGNVQSNRFNFNNKENWFVPTDCTLSRLSEGGLADHLLLTEDDNFEMSASMDSKWTFEYADL